MLTSAPALSSIPRDGCRLDNVFAVFPYRNHVCACLLCIYCGVCVYIILLLPLSPSLLPFPYSPVPSHCHRRQYCGCSKPLCHTRKLGSLGRHTRATHRGRVRVPRRTLVTQNISGWYAHYKPHIGCVPILLFLFCPHCRRALQLTPIAARASVHHHDESHSLCDGGRPGRGGGWPPPPAGHTASSPSRAGTTH